MSRPAQWNKKLAVLRKIREYRRCLFESASPLDKKRAWSVVLEKAKCIGLVNKNRDYQFMSRMYGDWKNKALKKVETNKQRAEFGGTEIRLTEVDKLVLEIIREKDSGNLPVAADCMSSSGTRDFKEPKSVFQIIQACCVSLVRDHGHSLSLFNEKPFREIMDYLPMTLKQKRSINAESIKRLVEQGDGDYDNDDDLDATKATDEDDDHANTSGADLRGHVKAEAVSCTCSPSVGMDGVTHADDCPAHKPPVYWSFFTVTVDEAACSLCSEVLTWTDLSTLKEHITNAHPTTSFYDDDQQFEKGPPTVGPQEDTEQIFFNEPEDRADQSSDPDQEDTPPPRKKRKLKLPKILPHKNMTRAQIAKAVDRFKSLDIFGQYVASLMKLLPKGKCVQFQIQIVEKLLRAQAAAG